MAAASVRSILVLNKTEAAGYRARCVLRFRPSPAWTPEEDARLLLAIMLGDHKEEKKWRRVASDMPGGRSPRQCRDRWRDHLVGDLYHRPFTPADDDELQRLFLRHGGRWKEIRRAVHGRTSRVLRRRWKEIRDSDAFLTKLWRRRPSAAAPATTTIDSLLVPSSLRAPSHQASPPPPCLLSFDTPPSTCSVLQL